MILLEQGKGTADLIMPVDDLIDKNQVGRRGAHTCFDCVSSIAI